MSKGTSIKDALSVWEKENETKAAEAEEVKLCAKYPPIEKMDASLSTLSCCVKLSLSTNAIEKITNLNGLKNIKILSLARNNIKNLNGLEAVGETLEELWISYNLIEKLKGVHVLKKLKILMMSNNLVKDWTEFNKLADCQNLIELVFTGNPLEITHSEAGDWQPRVSAAILSLKKCDAQPIIREEAEE